MVANSAPAPVACIHHLKFPVSDLDVSLAWYTSVMSANHVQELDHFKSTGERYAVELSMPAMGNTLLELRLDKESAATMKGMDPVTWGVETRADLQKWAGWLDNKGVKRSGVLTGVLGWVLAFEDPDGRFLRLYTLESHEMTTDVDRDDYWLGKA